MNIIVINDFANQNLNCKIAHIFLSVLFKEGKIYPNLEFA